MSETRRGLLTKLGIFSGIAIGLFLVGKKHIAITKVERHKRETDATIDSEVEEYGNYGTRPGFPANNPTLNYEADSSRASRYEGKGNSYSSRRPGDRFSMFAVFDRKWSDSSNNDANDKNKYYKPPSRSD
ncbi:hypothetical protein DFJ63DRAFT_183611 [Scheffersomyces coipomensis]|uniref:uncharacterized protein n=1 Tax=Scheffersomyces coipomensis TaxID=1788519 RepID=UPI00315CBFD5